MRLIRDGACCHHDDGALVFSRRDIRLVTYTLCPRTDKRGQPWLKKEDESSCRWKGWSRSNYPKTGCNPRKIQDLRAFSDSYEAASLQYLNRRARTDPCPDDVQVHFNSGRRRESRRDRGQEAQDMVCN